MVHLTIVAAISSNFVIGKDNDLVLTHKEDFKHFKELTKGHTVIMGRKTYESLPNGPLPDRINKVISNSKEFLSKQDVDYSTPHYSILKNGVTVIHDSEHYFYNLRTIKRTHHRFFIIGGAQIYNLFLQKNLVNDMVITYWNKPAEGDVLFPVQYMNDFEVSEVKEAQTSQEFKFFTFLHKTNHGQ